jgi:hypothetical protein
MYRLTEKMKTKPDQPFALTQKTEVHKAQTRLK